MQNEGPTPRPLRYTCEGCKHLKIKDWEFYGENDEIDRGTDADCMLVNRSIGTYYYSGDDTPDWCPLLPETTDAK